MLRALFAPLALAVLASSPAFAQESVVKIKLGTVAPQGSTWHTLLQEMGARWAELSGGKVQLKVYAGGTQGSEGEMVRKLGIGQLQAAAMTTIGLKEIVPDPEAEDTPGLIDSYAEYEAVHQKIHLELEAALEKKGYVVLNWGEAGFVDIFSTEPYSTPQEFAQGKVFAWSGDPASEEAWRAAGFKPVVLSSTDLITSLQTKMINIVSEPPLYAYTAGLYDKAHYMLDLKWGLLTGATIVKKETWEKIPPELREKLLVVAHEQGEKVNADVRKQNDEALEQMKAKGLTVVEPKDMAAWKVAYEAVQGVVRGKVVPAEIYDKVKALRDQYRAQGK